MDTISLTYISTALLPISAQELKRIHALSERNNRQHDITGALGFTGSCFLQCLEGTTDAVYPLLRRIEKDERHSGVLLLHAGRISARRFGQWSMAYVDSLSLDEEVSCAYRAAAPSEDAARVLLEKMAAALRPGESLHPITRSL